MGRLNGNLTTEGKKVKQLALYVGPNGATRVVPLRDPQAAVPEFTTEAGRVFRLSMIHHAFDLSPREIREAHERTEREKAAQLRGVDAMAAWMDATARRIA